MKRAAAVVGAALVLAVALLGAGCGSSSPPATDDQARNLASDAAQALTQLEDQTKALADRVDELESSRDRGSADLDAVTERLWSSLAKLRASLSDLEGLTDDAAANASAALAEAQAAANDLAVLDSRLDYHLRQHGGN
jgi:TolA-binding protein